MTTIDSKEDELISAVKVLVFSMFELALVLAGSSMKQSQDLKKLKVPVK